MTESHVVMWFDYQVWFKSTRFDVEFIWIYHDCIWGWTNLKFL